MTIKKLNKTCDPSLAGRGLRFMPAHDDLRVPGYARSMHALHRHPTTRSTAPVSRITLYKRENAWYALLCRCCCFLAAWAFAHTLRSLCTVHTACRPPVSGTAPVPPSVANFVVLTKYPEFAFSHYPELVNRPPRRGSVFTDRLGLRPRKRSASGAKGAWKSAVSLKRANERRRQVDYK